MHAATKEYESAIDRLRGGKREEGIELLLALQRRYPQDARLSDGLARAYTEAGEFDRALYAAERTLELRPSDASAAVFVVHVLICAGRSADAVKRSTALLPVFSRDTNFVLFAATALQNVGRREEAEAVLKEFVRAVGPDPFVLSALGLNLLHQGRATEAERELRRSLAQFPGHLNTLVALATTLNYVDGADRAEVFNLYREFGRRYEANFPVIDPLSYENAPDPERIIRVGLMTSDLREHPVARFVEPILQHHDRSRVHIAVYYTYPVEDRYTASLRPLADEWRSVRTTRAEVVSREVYKDRIDVLFELGGLTGNATLTAMVPQVAPVQVSAIGYANTTGLRTVGYRIVDSRTDRPGEADAFATEQLVRLDPCFLCFQPLEAPAPEPSPVHGTGRVTFGSFNNIIKYTDEVFAIWARILERVPDSRLLLKNGSLAAPRTRERILERLGRAGITQERIELMGSQTSVAHHLSRYNLLDVALDSFPYNGTTTTCEALLMGVPVIALEGAPHAARVGVSLLHAAGVPEFLASSREDYIEKAVAAATSAQESTQPRTELRQKFLASALCDGPAYAARWQEAVRSMWRTWCERKRNQSSLSARP
ncbi:MAG: tetratricopeptide repeat protein [Phycisphaeraceae bacterium]|nr:tetratricopeptide repeat protein [Phycisphaeraceae bacterium]